MKPGERSPRSYRFERLDRSGVLLGLGWAGLVTVTAGLAVTVALLAAQANLWVTVTVGAASGLVAYAPVGPISTLEWVRVIGSWITAARSGSSTWTAPVTPTDSASATTEWSLHMPPCLAGLSIVATAPGVGAVLDSRAGTRTALIPVAGSGFLLATDDAQEVLLEGWGSVIAGFATEHRAVARLSWSSFVAPGDDHLAWLDGQHGASGDDAASVAYRELVAEAAAVSVRPEVIVAVTVAGPARRSRRRADTDPLARAVAGLRHGLEQAGLATGPSMSPAGIAAALQVRLHPTSPIRATGPGEGSLAARLGAASGGPAVMVTEWDAVRVDGTWHRSYWVMDWPRAPQPASWLEPLVATTDAARREVTVIMEPSPPSQAKARLDRAIRRQGSDEIARDDGGQRTTAAHRQAQRELLEREAELVSGHAEVAFVGLVRVTADSRDRLQQACLAVEQQARERQVALQVLLARQDSAFAASLPFGLGVDRIIQ